MPAEVMVRAFKASVSFIGLVSEWIGKAVMWVVVAMVLTICYNVFMRYVLNAPTLWSFDVNYMMGGTLMILGMAYVQKHRRHVSVDALSVRFPEKTKLIIDIVFTTVFFIPVFFMVSRTFWLDCIHAFTIGETTQTSAWFAPIWPFKAVLAVGFSLFWMQGLATLVEDLYKLAKGGETL